MAVCFSACNQISKIQCKNIDTTIVKNDTIKFDTPLKPNGTAIVIPNQLNSLIGQYVERGLQDVYKLPYNYQTFPVLREHVEFATSIYPDTAGKIFISVGNTFMSDSVEAKKLPPCSFIIKKNGRYISITGSDDNGNYAGVEYFLSHYCGITHYMPGSLFTSVKSDSTISLPSEINIVDSPFTRNITSTGFYGTGNPENKSDVHYWDNYWALLNSLKYTDWGSFQHTMSALFCDSLIMKFYPDAYPVINSKRYYPTSSNDQEFEPNFASPQLVDASFDVCINYFTHNPFVKTIAFSVMDGSGGYTFTGQPLIDANANWMNRLAKRVTDRKTIAYLSYSAVDGYPSFKLEPNVLPITVWHLSDFPSDGWGRIDSIAKFTSRIGNDDWAEGKGFIFPRIYTRILSIYLRGLQKKEIKFDYAHIEAYPNWGLDGIKYWEMGKIYRNPNLDVDSLRLKFCTDLFGNANLQMKAYFDTMEDIGLWLNNTGIGTHLYNYPQQFKLDSSRLVLVGNCRKYLDAATNLAVTKEQKERVQFFNTGFTFIENLWKLYNLKQGDKTSIKKYMDNNVIGSDRILFIGNDSIQLNNIIKGLE